MFPPTDRSSASALSIATVSYRLLLENPKNVKPNHSATFKIDDRFDEDTYAWIGSTMVVRAPFTGSDIVVTICRG